jgi:prepilin-type N-terminal cleavage/methylation domain-containing protein
MKKKLRGFTLIELIIAISLTLVILGAAFTFFIVNNRNLIRVDLQSTLQTEGKDIEEKVLKVGTKTREIVSLINNSDDREVVNNNLGTIKLDGEDKLAIKEIVLNSYENSTNNISTNNSFTISLDGRTLKIISPSGERVLSRNVKELKVKPLNLNQIANRNSKTIKQLDGVELSMTLELKKGSVTVENPVSVVVKFRNSEELISEAKKKVEDVRNKVYSSIYRSEGFKSINDKSSSDIIFRNNDEIPISNIILKQYDGSDVAIYYSENELKLGDTVISDKVKEVKIIPIVIDGKDENNKKANEISGFEISIILDLGDGKSDLTYPITIIVKFKDPIKDRA